MHVLLMGLAETFPMVWSCCFVWISHIQSRAQENYALSGKKSQSANQKPPLYIIHTFRSEMCVHLISPFREEELISKNADPYK